jgi:hypothetical protein
LFFGQDSGDSSLGGNRFLSLFSVGFIGFLGCKSDDSGVGVKSIHEFSVFEGIFLLDFVSNEVGGFGSDDGLDFIGVDDSGEVGIFHSVSLELVTSFFRGVLSDGSEESIQSLEGRLGPDAESSNLTTGGQLFKRKSVNIGDFDSGDVSEGLDEFDVFVGVNDEGSFSDSVSSVSHFSFSGSESFGVNNFLDVFINSKSLEELDGIFGFFIRFDSVFDDEGNFGDLFGSVSSGEHKGVKGGGGKGSGDSVSSLGHIDLSVPSSVGFEGSEHSSLSAHITESGLSGSVGTRSRNSGNSCHGSTGSPGFGGVFHTSINIDSVSLSGVFG